MLEYRWWAYLCSCKKNFFNAKHLKKQETNKDLLYSTGNSTQYSVMTYMGKESKKVKKKKSGFRYDDSKWNKSHRKRHLS